jgi:hypothetical protein
LDARLVVRSGIVCYRAGKAMARLRRTLEELPEIEHPLGF